MQINTIKISNILSFPYIENLEQHTGIQFHNKEKGTMNIIIGPNGSGKSNFLEIINQVMKKGILNDFVYNYTILRDSNNTQSLKTVIHQEPTYIDHLTKHFSYDDKPSHVNIDITISKNDIDNMMFIQKFRKQLHTIIQKYSTLEIEFPIIDIDTIEFETTLHLEFFIDTQSKTIDITNTPLLSPNQKAILQYLQNSELIQICMKIYNQYEKGPNDRRWYPLKNTFAVLGSYRHFEEIVESKKSMTPQERNAYIGGHNTKSNFGMAFGYYLCTLKLWDMLYKIHAECTITNPEVVCTYESLYTDLKETSYFQGLYNMIYEYLNLKLELLFIDEDFYFLLRDPYDQIHHFHELSAGEQSFLMMILTFYGFDLENGFMIIDEPELHLHPQMQKKCLHLIQTLSEKHHIQCMVATHSPVMINEQNIYHVYRFTKPEMNTMVYSPSYTLTGDEATLIHMLKFGHVVKIFFVQKIIMVEGETDAYFFEYLIDYYIQSKTCDRNTHIKDYEVININGKGSYTKWKHFLSKFGLQSYFVGDRDNIIEKGIMIDIKKLEKHAKHSNQIQQKPYRKVHRYENIIHSLKEYNPEIYRQTMHKIQNMYEKGVFILQKGDLEAYIGVHKKGLDDTIDFCNNDFIQRLHNPRYAEKRQELENIFRHIFTGGS